MGKSDGTELFSLSSNNTIKEEALSALVMLGFSKMPAEKALTKIMTETPNLTVEELIKRTLKSL